MKKYAAFLALEAMFFWLALENIGTTPVMLDEFAHLPAGVSYWETGRFSIYRESPPLIRYVTALPAYLSGARLDYRRASLGHRSEWLVGIDFVNANGPRYDAYLWQARLVVILMAVACGSLVYVWCSELYGRVAAAVAAALWFLNPNVIAHACMASTDVGTALAATLAAYCFWRCLRVPSRSRIAVAGVALGLAESAKFSLLALYPAWVAMMAIAWVTARGAERQKPRWRDLGIIFTISLAVLNALYLFDGIGQPLGTFAFRSRLLSGRATDDLELPPVGNRFRNTALDRLPVMLPRDYVIGFDSQKWEEEVGFCRLEEGRLVPRGRWYSPLETLAYKLPLGTLLLVLGGLIGLVARPRKLRVADAVVLLPALSMVLLLCSQTGMNWLVRYAIPALPFLFLAAGAGASAGWGQPLGRVLVVGCLIWNVAALIIIRPHYMSYGNELVGGPQGAQRVFLGSNFDWGQDLLRLKAWSDQHPDIRPLVVTFFGMITPDVAGIKEEALPASLLERGTESPSRSEADPRIKRDFYWAISSNILNGMVTPPIAIDGARIETVLQSPLLKPENAIARIGYTIYIFHVVPDDEPEIRPFALRQGDLRGCLREVRKGDHSSAP